MEKRKRINSKWGRLLYLPLAILQWCFYTIIFSGLGFFLLTLIFSIYGIGFLILLDYDDSKKCFYLASMPLVLPFKWWVDYFKNGEIGTYK